MENASKALLMAAGVMVGILVLSLAVYLFVSFGSASARVHERIRTDQIIKYNEQFLGYIDRETITIYDIVSLAKLATEHNIENDLEYRNSVSNSDDPYIYIILKTDTEEIKLSGGTNNNREEKQTELIEEEVKKIGEEMGNPYSKDDQDLGDEVGNIPNYKCIKKELNKTTGIVKLIKFEKK